MECQFQTKSITDILLKIAMTYIVVLRPGYSGRTHYSDVMMATMASQITSLTIVYSTVYSGADQRKKTKLRGPVNSPHKWPVTRKMFPFADVIM